MSRVIIYTKATCPYCIKAKELLKSKNIEFKEIELSENPEAFNDMVSLANGSKTVPQIFIDGEHIGGYSNLLKLSDNGILEFYFQQTENQEAIESENLSYEKHSDEILPEVLIDADMSTPEIISKHYIN